MLLHNFLTESIQAVDPGEIIEYMIDCILTGKYWDTYSISKKPHLAISWETAEDMAITWDDELPKHIREMDIYDIIDTPEFSNLVRSWAVARYKEVTMKLEALPHPGGHYRIHRTMRTVPLRLTRFKYADLGVYWTYNRDGWHDEFKPIWATRYTPGKDIIIEADVMATSVDWRTTILANMDWMVGDREFEMRLIKTAPIKVLDILDWGTEESLGIDFSRTVFTA